MFADCICYRQYWYPFCFAPPCRSNWGRRGLSSHNAVLLNPFSNQIHSPVCHLHSLDRSSFGLKLDEMRGDQIVYLQIFKCLCNKMFAIQTAQHTMVHNLPIAAEKVQVVVKNSSKRSVISSTVLVEWIGLDLRPPRPILNPLDVVSPALPRDTDTNWPL